MPDESDWLFRPLLRGLCKYSDYHDGTLDLHAIAELNDLLDIEAENNLRMQKTMNHGK